ncbi:MAG: tetratricopeptide repeat protein [Anaerolineae bacterium]
MTHPDLQRAYQLIQAGNRQEAIALLEPIIRANRDNEDAWWLLANATDEPIAKRNALNNVLRLSEQDNRLSKAQALLQQLDQDPFDFDVPEDGSSRTSSYREIDETPPKSARGMSCSRLTLIVVGLIGVCACIASFGIYSLAGGIVESLNYPPSSEDRVTLSPDTAYDDTLSAEQPQDRYQYQAQEGDLLTVVIDYEVLGSPLIVLFDDDTGTLLDFAQPVTTGTVTFTYRVPADGDYLITVNGFELLGQAFGFGEYTLTFAVE